MNKKYWIKKTATALALIVLIKLLSLPFAVACSFLQCTNFTDPQKEQDCDYTLSQGLSESEEQEVLCVLWDENYDYNLYQPPNYSLNTTLSLDYHEIDTSSFILAFKIIILLLFSYFVYCVLTKPSFIRKWVAV